jgi:hypothetical protein
MRLKMQARQVVALVIVVTIIALAFGTILGYGIFSGKTTTLMATQTFSSTATSNRTVTLTQTTTLPPNEVVTKVIIFQVYTLYPVIYSTNCVAQNAGGSLGITSSTETSYIGTTTASAGTTVTVYDHENISSVYIAAENNLTTATYTIVTGNSTVTTTCLTGS